MRPPWREYLCPSPPRDFPARRLLKIALRAVHALCSAVYVGGVVFAVPATAIGPWALATAGSGAALLAVHLYATATFLLEMRGLLVLLKVLLVGVASLVPSAAPWLLAAVFAGSVLSSHAHGSFRHRTWAGSGAAVIDRTRG